MRVTPTKSLGLLALSAVFLTAACDMPNPVANPGDEAVAAGQAALAKGNNFPAGPHDYKVNIIGVAHDKSADMDNNNGRRIFVRLESDNEVTSPGGKNNHLKKGGGNDQNHIYLCNSTNDEGDSTDDRCAAYGNPDDWGVIDANATDGDGALLAVPDPCAGDDILDGCTPRYAVYARARAGHGSATITTCGEEEQAFDGEQDTWCGSNGITLYPTKGRKATDVTENLLHMTIVVDDSDDADPELAACIDPNDDDDAPDEYDVYLFDRCFQDYFWNYDNNGLKNLELRFYWAD